MSARTRSFLPTLNLWSRPMMQYRSIPMSALLWLIAVSTMIGGWGCMIAGHHHVAVMLGFTALMVSAIAAVSTIGGMALRTQGLVRACHGLERPDHGPDLRSIH